MKFKVFLFIVFIASSFIVKANLSGELKLKVTKYPVSGQAGSVSLNWTTTGTTSTLLTVQIGNGIEKSMKGTISSGSTSASWITYGNVYTFRLYGYEDGNKILIDQVVLPLRMEWTPSYTSISTYGQVGIGIDTPNANLHINSFSEGEKLLWFGTDRPWYFTTIGRGADERLRLVSSTNNKRFEITNALGSSVATFIASDTKQQVFLVPDGGTVGIGKVPSPENTLDVAGAIQSSSKLQINTGAYKSLIGISGPGSYLWLEDKDANQNVLIRSYGDSFLKGGGLGIGTSSLNGYKLNINGKSFFNDNISIGTGKTPTANVTIYDKDNPVSINFQSQTAGRYWIVSQANQLQIGGANASLPGAGAININNSGAVAIGGEPYWGTRLRVYGNLAVKGKIEAEDIEVKILSWEDRVFKENYTLRSLDAVKTFIADNKHLPEVPSESEVLENGINLGDMNALLLKKVEELTLYLIEQNERIKKLEEMNEVLKNEIGE